MQQINFTGDLDQQAIMFFIIEETKEIILSFLQETLILNFLQKYCKFILL